MFPSLTPSGTLLKIIGQKIITALLTEGEKPHTTRVLQNTGEQNIALTTLVILIGFCTLAVLNKKLRPSKQQEF